MSDFPARPADSAVPQPTTATGTDSGDSSALAPVGTASSGELQRLNERLSFYESFDEIIKQNIGRSSQLLREAAAKRDEATATIERTLREQAVERETQRATLAELLDDVMTIQQVTERLAHRVSEALELVEFSMEPTGLTGRASLPATAPNAALGLGSRRALVSEAEGVHEEWSAGTFSPPRSAPSTGSLPAFHDGESAAESPVADAANLTLELADEDELAGTATLNPETAESDPAEEITDAPQSGGEASSNLEAVEPTPGEGAEATPVETSAEFWSDTVVTQHPAAEAAAGYEDIATPADAAVSDEGTPTAEAVDEDSGASFSLNGSSPEPAKVDPAASVPDAGFPGLTAVEPETEAESATSSATGAGTDSAADESADPAAPTETATSVDDLDISAMTEDEATTSKDAATSEEPRPGGQSTSATLPSIDLVANNAARTDRVVSSIPVADAVTADGAASPRPVMATTTTTPAQQRSTTGEQASAASETSTTTAAPPVTLAVAPLPEQRTTLILNGVPRAAVALSIQRHILSRPEVLRAEVREYYDHRLTLSVTSQRPTEQADLAEWDPSASWDVVNQQPGLLELRLEM